MSILENLLVEQTKAGNVANTRPYLVQLSKTVAQRVFRDMVAVQPTNNPDAQIFGLKYHTDEGDVLYDNALTRNGAFHDKVQSLPKLTTSVTKDTVYFSEQDKGIYIAVKNGQLDSVDEIGVLKGVIQGVIRLFSDASSVDYFENKEAPEMEFTIGKWVVPCNQRKVRVTLTQELIQDLEANGLDSAEIIENTLAGAIVNEVNKDIISKLMVVSKRFDNKQFNVKDGFCDLSTKKDPQWSIGRDINAMIGAAAADMLTNTTYSATYVIVSPNVYGLLCGAGLVVFNEESQMTRSHGYLRSGLKVYIDTYNKFDYFIVGCKHNISVAEDELKTLDKADDSVPSQEEIYESEDLVGQLYYCPYLEEDGQSIYVTRDYNSLNNSIMLTTRYGLSVNPFTINGAKINQGNDWNNLVGKSKLSVMVGLKLA